MQLENIDKEHEEEIPEDSHILHFWEPCKFEIDDDFDFVNDEYGTTNQDKAPEVAHKEENKPAEIPAPEVPANEGMDDSEELPF